MDVADFILKQQADPADDEIQHDEFEQTPRNVFAARFGLGDEENPLEQKREVGGYESDKQQDNGVEIHVWWVRLGRHNRSVLPLAQRGFRKHDFRTKG